MYVIKDTSEEKKKDTNQQEKNRYQPVRRDEARDLEERAPGSQSDTVVDTEKIPARFKFFKILMEIF